MKWQKHVKAFKCDVGFKHIKHILFIWCQRRPLNAAGHSQQNTQLKVAGDEQPRAPSWTYLRAVDALVGLNTFSCSTQLVSLSLFFFKTNIDCKEQHSDINLMPVEHRIFQVLQCTSTALLAFGNWQQWSAELHLMLSSMLCFRLFDDCVLSQNGGRIGSIDCFMPLHCGRRHACWCVANLLHCSTLHHFAFLLCICISLPSLLFQHCQVVLHQAWSDI